MRIESDGHSRGNPRLYELIEHAPKTGKSPTVWAWPELIDYLKVAGQPVPGPWPPHQQPRPDPEEDSLPVAYPTRIAARGARPDPRPAPDPETYGQTPDGHLEDRMYPSRFRYEAPRSLDEAISLLRDGGDYAKVLAGGQSLVPLMKLRFAVAGARRRHQQRARAGLPPGRTGRHPAHRRPVPARRPGALGPAEDHAAHHGRGRPADRRPHRPQPRHPGRLAMPRRPAGRLGLGGAGARRLGGRPGPGGTPHHPAGRASSPARSRTCWTRTRSRSRP